MAGGAVGAAVSGGRATLIIGTLSVCGILLLRRKIIALFCLLLLGIVGAAVANLSADWINTKADPFLQRSLQSILIHKKGEAIKSIENSTDWRREVFDRAIEEWRSSPRIFWTGRGTYGFGTADETSMLIVGGYRALIEISLRRGATHNLISDLLVTYGLIGAVLYLTLVGAILRFLWTLYHRRDLSPPAANLAVAAFVASVLWLIYSLIGGNYYPAECVWFMIILVAGFYTGAATEERRKAPTVARIPARLSRQQTPFPPRQRRPVLSGRGDGFAG
jgi:O-antigen ligase